MVDNYFLKMIETLRRQEEIVLYGNILQPQELEEEAVIAFLKQAYTQETLEFPFVAPPYDADAALWAAQTVYVAAQLILYRENKDNDLALLLPDFTVEMNAGAILSVDLCLRFLPDMIVQLKLIDNEDALIAVLENKLYQWHYSGINYPLETDRLDFENIIADDCIWQLYINRVIENKKLKLAQHPACIEHVKASLGIYEQQFWNEFKTATTIHE